MKVIGKFTSYKVVIDEVRIAFHISEEIVRAIEEVHPLLEEPLIFNFRGKFKCSGEVESYRGQKGKIILNLVLNTANIDNIKHLDEFAGYHAVDIELEVDHTVERKPAKVDIGFIGKINFIITQIGNQISHDKAGTTKLLLYAGEFGRLKVTSSMYQFEAESFYLFMKTFVEDKKIKVKIDARYDSTESYLKHCREDCRCVLCGRPSFKQVGLYAVCKKHKAELKKIGTSEFEKKYKLRN